MKNGHGESKLVKDLVYTGISQRKNRKTAKQNMKIAKQEARERRRK